MLYEPDAYGCSAGLALSGETSAIKALPSKEMQGNTTNSACSLILRFQSSQKTFSLAQISRRKPRK